MNLPHMCYDPYMYSIHETYVKSCQHKINTQLNETSEHQPKMEKKTTAASPTQPISRPPPQPHADTLKQSHLSRTILSHIQNNQHPK